jgi:hypothetical protein
MLPFRIADRFVSGVKPPDRFLAVQIRSVSGYEGE